MQQTVIVRCEGKDRWTARSASIPSVRADAATELDAIDQVRRSLIELFAGGELVPVEVPAPASNPWLDHFAGSADDPDFAEHVAAVGRIRDELNRR